MTTLATRKRKLVNRKMFERKLPDLERIFQVTKRTKYHYTIQRMTPAGHLNMPTQAYPSALKIIPYEGEPITCTSNGDFMDRIKEIVMETD